MTDCPNGEIRDLLPAYLNDRLSAASRGEVEAHLAGCDECRAELALLRDLRTTMQRGPTVDVRAIAAAIPPYRAPVRRGTAMAWRSAAAIIAIAAGGTSIALLSQAGDRPAHRIPVPPVVARAPTTTVPDSVIVATVTTPASRATTRSTRSAETSSATASGRELAIASSAIGELSDGELASLFEGLESLDALPSAEIEGSDGAASLAQEESR